jgi:DNA-binding NarL/FixJ family response regulator
MTGVGPDVLLLDVMLSPPDGVTTMPLWQRLCPTTKIVLLTRSPNAREGVLALKAGARGYCEQDIVPSLLRKAVDRVQRGEIWVGRTVVPRLLEELALLTERRQAAVPVIVGGRLERLTHRQVEIARMIGGGSSNKEIAMRLDISLKTVKAHLTAIFRKLGFSDRLRLALFVASESFQRVKT